MPTQPPRHLVCITFDFDTVSLWQAMGQTSPTPISRGEFGVVGAERLLDLLAKYKIPSTWFMPGLTIDTFEPICARVAAAGHEIGHHGYDHVAPASLSREQEREQLQRGNEAIRRINGSAAQGYRSPAWDLSENTVSLLMEAGFVYDSSMMGHDCLPYRARQGDVVEPGAVMQFGQPSNLWELPVSWSADDFPHFEYFRGGGLRQADDVLANWLDDFDYMQTHETWGVLTYTFHPFVIGRGHRMKMLEKFLQQLLESGAHFVTAQVAIAEFSALDTEGSNSLVDG